MLKRIRNGTTTEMDLYLLLFYLLSAVAGGFIIGLFMQSLM